MERAKRYADLAKAQLRLELPMLALCAPFLLAAALMFGLGNLDVKGAAAPLETVVSLCGAVLLAPLYVPEYQPGVSEAAEAKAMGYTGVLLVRLAVAVLLLLAVTSGYTLLLALAGSNVPLVSIAAGSFASGLALGASGLLVCGISGNPVLGCLGALLYYALCLNPGTARLLGRFYLFSMTRGSFTEKYWLLALGALLIAASLLLRSLRARLR